MWTIKTQHSTAAKFISVNSGMTTKEFMERVSKLFNLKQRLICVTYQFAAGGSTLAMEIEDNDENSLSHAIEHLPNYSLLTVEVKRILTPQELIIQQGKRVVRTKEILSEEIKREMGLHDDSGRRKRGFLDAKWSVKCTELLSEDTRFLLEFDKLKSGVKLVFGDGNYLLNPFQVVCPICLEIKVLGSMNQLRALLQHLREVHSENGNATRLCKRLMEWMSNNFITNEALDEIEKLPDGLSSIVEILAKPRVRNAFLTRDIPEGHLQ